MPPQVDELSVKRQRVVMDPHAFNPDAGWRIGAAVIEDADPVDRNILEETSAELMRACQRCMQLEQDLEASEDRVVEIEQLLEGQNTQTREASSQVAHLRATVQAQGSDIQQLQAERQEVWPTLLKCQRVMGRCFALNIAWHMQCSGQCAVSAPCSCKATCM